MCSYQNIWGLTPLFTSRFCLIKTQALKKKKIQLEIEDPSVSIFIYPLPLQRGARVQGLTDPLKRTDRTGTQVSDSPRVPLPFPCGYVPNHNANSVTSTNKLLLAIINFLNAIKKTHHLLLL